MTRWLSRSWARAAIPAGLASGALLAPACEPRAPLVVAPTLAALDGGPENAPRVAARELGDAPASLLGRWEGLGIESDGTRWPMEVEIHAVRAGPCAHATYPTMPCAATWTCTSDSGSDRLIAIEHLTEGAEVCADEGTMRARLAPDGTLRWTWTGEDGRRAQATLRRAR